MRHEWNRLSAVFRPVGRDEECTIECQHCGTVKIQVWHYDGTVSPARYAYPEDYLAQGIGRIGQAGMAALRLESRSRRQRAR